LDLKCNREKINQNIDLKEVFEGPKRTIQAVKTWSMDYFIKHILTLESSLPNSEARGIVFEREKR
jgi:hypothetical protein